MAQICIRLSEKELAALEEAADGLKKLGSVLRLQDQAEENELLPVFSDCSGRSLSEIEKYSDFLKGTRTNLQSVNKLIERRLADLEEHRNFERSTLLKKLPDEILSNIMSEFNNLTGSEPGPIVTVSHICRRLRRVAVETRNLWTTLSNGMAMPLLDLFLHRAKTTGLVIHMNGRPGDGELVQDFRGHRVSKDFMDEDFLATVLPHCNHWVEFYYYADSHSSIEPATLSCMKDKLSMPLLRRLEIDVDEFTDSQLCKHWDMPALEHIGFLNESVRICHFSGTGITSCRITLDDTYDYDYDYDSDYDLGWELCSLFAALSALPRLEDLKLEFVSVHDDVREFKGVNTVLESGGFALLKSLWVAVGYGGFESLSVQSFFSAFQMPSLLALRYTFVGDVDPKRLAELAPLSHQCPLLRDLVIDRDLLDGPRTVDLRPIFERFTCIHHLTIRGFERIASLSVAPSPPPLRTFTFACLRRRKIPITHLRKIATYLHSGTDKGINLTKFRISTVTSSGSKNQNPDYTEKELRRLRKILGSKLEFEP